MKKESPEYVRLSLAAAMTLGYKGGLFHRNAKSPCINLLLTYDSGCAGNCAYCGLSMKRPGRYKEKSFIRVRWDSFELDDIIARVREREGDVKRVCISMITNSRAREDTVKIAQKLTSQTGVPVSVLISPTVTGKDSLHLLKESGVQMVGIAMDSAREDIFNELRGEGVNGPHIWDRYWDCFNEGVELFGRKMVGIHLIVGLGETEKDMIKLIQKIHEAGGSTHLFSFFPEGESQLAGHHPPTIGHYRRVQLARYLIDEEKARISDLEFSEEGRLLGCNIDSGILESAIESGLPFLTSGCPNRGGADCNRPYSDSIPGEEIRNFPFPPEKEDIVKIGSQLWS